MEDKINKVEFIDDCISSGKVLNVYINKLPNELIIKIENILISHNDKNARKKILMLCNSY